MGWLNKNGCIGVNTVSPHSLPAAAIVNGLTNFRGDERTDRQKDVAIV